MSDETIIDSSILRNDETCGTSNKVESGREYTGIPVNEVIYEEISIIACHEDPGFQ